MTTEELAQSRILFTHLLEAFNTTVERDHLQAHVIIQACGSFVAQIFAHESFPAEVPRAEREEWLTYFLAKVGEQVRSIWKPYDAR